MANKRANHKTPKPGQGPIKIRSKNGEYSTSTWPWQRKNKAGVQLSVPGIVVSDAWLNKHAPNAS